MKPQRKTRLSSGFSMVELVIVILIIAVLAVAIFAGSSIAVEKSREKRVTSDFHNFDVGAENYLYSNQQFQNGATLTTLAAQQEAILDLNPFLSANYAFDTSVQAPATGDICNTDASLYAFPSAKMDPWGNPYYVIIDNQSRNLNETETYLTVFSAGKNGKADMGGALDKDDQFLLLQFINGEVISKTYSMKESPKDAAGKTLTAGQTRLSSASGVAPVNKAVTMAASSGGTTGGGSSSGGSSGGTTPSRPSEGGGSSSGGSSGGGESGDSSTTVCNHAYTLTSMKQATCKANGEEKYTCAKCGNVYTKSTPKLEHNYAMVVSRTPSCTLEGEKKYTCSNCGDTYTEEIAKIAHSYEKASTIASTCTVAGKEIYKCKTCTDSYEKALPLINHKYGTDHKCTMCGQKDPNYAEPAPTLKAQSDWFKYRSSYRDSIYTISFVKEYTPTGSEKTSWNADVNNTGAIKAYIVGSNLIISAEGAEKIKANEDSSSVFSGLRAMKNISGLNLLDTSSATTMRAMFYGCAKLVDVDVLNFNTSNVTSMENMFCGCSSLKSINLKNFDTSKTKSMGSMFSGCSNLTAIDVSNFNTSNVNSMESMFSNCAVNSLNVSAFDTSHVSTMRGMFSGCRSLKSLDVSGFVTNNVTNMAGMFSGCTALTSLNLGKIDTSKVTTMSQMFWGCSNLPSLNVSEFNTSNVQKMDSMFASCSALTELDLSNFDTSSVTSMDSLFAQSFKLSSINVSSFNTSKTTNMKCMFYGCSKLRDIDLSNFDTSKVTDMWQMFGSCRALTSLDLSGFDTSAVTNMSNMFLSDSALQTIYASTKWSTDNATNSTQMFYGCSKLKGDIDFNPLYLGKTYAKIDGGYLTSIYTMKSSEGWYKGTVAKKTITKITFMENYTPSSSVDEMWNADVRDKGTIKVYRTGTELIIAPNGGGKIKANANSQTMFGSIAFTMNIKEINNLNLVDMRYVTNALFMFQNCRNLASLDLSEVHFDSLLGMWNMFYECRSLTSLDLSGFNTSKVTAMNHIFYNCTSLTDLNISGFDTSKVTSMQAMFYGCTKLVNLDVTKFDTSNVTDMFRMFSYCRNLTELNLSNFNTNKVKYMNEMFKGCISLESLDLRNFDTSSVVEMGGMFKYCEKLKQLDLTNFNTSSVTSMFYKGANDNSGMFEGCASLQELDLSSFDTGKVTDMQRMFYGCKALRTIYVSDKWATDNVTASGFMFWNCAALKGDIAYADTSSDKTYATAVGGYLTMKKQSSEQISFTIEGVTYTARKGMTFGEWLNSTYSQQFGGDIVYECEHCGNTVTLKFIRDDAYYCDDPNFENDTHGASYVQPHSGGPEIGTIGPDDELTNGMTLELDVSCYA